MIERTKKPLGFIDCDLHEVRLRKSLGIIACLIEQGSRELWPIFEKLEDELCQIEQRQTKLSQFLVQ